MKAVWRRPATALLLLAALLPLTMHVAATEDAARQPEAALEAGAARALLQATLPAAPPGVKYCTSTLHQRKHHHHLGGDSSAPVTTTTTSSSTDEPTIDDPDCIPPPVVTEASTEHSSTTEGPSGSASDSSGYNGGGGGGVRYITLPTDNGGSEFVPTDEVHYAPAPAPALTDSEINGLIGQISSDFNGFDNMYWKGNRPVAGGPGSAPAPAPTVMLGPGGTAPGDVTVQENFLTPVQQKQLHDLIVNDPNAVTWCPLCEGQIVPPLPPQPFNCPACPVNQVCASCTPGSIVPPDTTMYLKVGQCPACNGPTIDNLHVIHNQLPGDQQGKFANAAGNAQQNGVNVTLHVKHHHWGHGHKGAVTVNNITFNPDVPYNPGRVPSSTDQGLSSSSSTTSTSTTSTSTEAPYDYVVSDIEYVTTTTEFGAVTPDVKRVIPIGVVVGTKTKKSHTHGSHANSPPVNPAPGEQPGKQVVTRVLPGNVLPLPAVNPRAGTVNGVVYTPAQQQAAVESYHRGLVNFWAGEPFPGSATSSENPGVPVPTDDGFTPAQQAGLELYVKTNPTAVRWCPLCAGQAPPPVPPVQMPCPTCPAAQVCGSCLAGPQPANNAITMYLGIGTCLPCTGQTKVALHQQHEQAHKAHHGKSELARQHAEKHAANVTIETFHHKKPGTPDAYIMITNHTYDPQEPSSFDYAEQGLSSTSTTSSTTSTETSSTVVPSPPPAAPPASPAFERILGPGGVPEYVMTPGAVIPTEETGPGGVLFIPGPVLPKTPGAKATPMPPVKQEIGPNGKPIYILPAVEKPPSGPGVRPVGPGGVLPSGGVPSGPSKPGKPGHGGKSAPVHPTGPGGVYVGPGGATPGVNPVGPSGGKPGSRPVGPGGVPVHPLGPGGVNPGSGPVAPGGGEYPVAPGGGGGYAVRPVGPGGVNPGVKPVGPRAVHKAPPAHYRLVPGPAGTPPVRQLITPTVGVTTGAIPPAPLVGPKPGTAFWSTTTTSTDVVNSDGKWTPAPPMPGYWCSICLDRKPPALAKGAHVVCPPCTKGQICPQCPSGSVVEPLPTRRSLLHSFLPSWLEGGKEKTASDSNGGDIARYTVGITSTLPRNLGGPTVYLSATECTTCP